MTNSVQMLERDKLASHAMSNAIAAKVQETAQQTAKKEVPFEQRYSSPIVAMDPQTGVAILQYRNSISGEETYQLPDKVSLAYEKNQVQASEKGADTNADKERSDSNSK